MERRKSLLSLNHPPVKKQQLFDSIREGNLDVFKQLLDEGFDINIQTNIHFKKKIIQEKIR